MMCTTCQLSVCSVYPLFWPNKEVNGYPIGGDQLVVAVEPALGRNLQSSRMKKYVHFTDHHSHVLPRHVRHWSGIFLLAPEMIVSDRPDDHHAEY